jgi:formylmethanofuran dehydrogenase subunit E
MAVFSPTFEDAEIYADTPEQAREIALLRFISLVTDSLFVYEAKARTERCDICQQTYPPSEIKEIGGERLCTSCYWDKHQSLDENIPLEDIPF